jgi:hypothetical protein
VTRTKQVAMGCCSSVQILAYALKDNQAHWPQGIERVGPKFSDEKDVASFISICAEAFCGTTTTAPEGAIHYILGGAEAGGYGPLTAPPSNERMALFHWIVGWVSLMAMDYGGCFGLRDENGELCAACVAYPASAKMSQTFPNEMGMQSISIVMGKGKAYSIGNPPTQMNDKAFKARDSEIKKGQSELHHAHGANCWYVSLLGVKASAQGKGYGKKMLLWMNQLADADGAPLYLEAVGERNQQLYERFGYKVVGRTLEHVNGGLRAMVRSPIIDADAGSAVVTPVTAVA